MMKGLGLLRTVPMARDRVSVNRPRTVLFRGINEYTLLRVTGE